MNSNENLSLDSLREKLKYYRRVVMDSREAIIIQDFNGVVKAWNQSAERIYGFSAKEMVGENITKIIAEDERASAISNLKSIREGNPGFRIRQTRLTKDKKKVFVNITYSPIYESEEIIEIGTTEEDITPLKLSEEKFKKLFEMSGDGLILADAKTKKFLKVNPTICKMTGYSKEELLKMSVTDLHPKEDLPEILKLFGDSKVTPPIPVLRKDKTVFYSEVQSSKISNGGEYFLGAFRDVTEKKNRRKH